MEVNVFSIIFGSFFVALKFWDICELSITIQHQPNSAILSACISLGDEHCRVEERDLAFHRQERGSAFWWNIWKNTRNQIGIFLLAIFYLHNTLNLFPDSSKCLKPSTNQIPKKLKFKAARCLESGSLMLCWWRCRPHGATWCHMVPGWWKSLQLWPCSSYNWLYMGLYIR